MPADRIRSLASKYKNEFIEVRHYLHAHPELSYQEFETSLFVQEKLASFGIRFQTMATTGVVGIINGNDSSDRVVALRADMDALPIEEANNISYKSTKPGVMHACGHDVHTTCLLGAAKILQETKDQWGGAIKLIFQPGEEKNPGGASLMIKDGVLDDPSPSAIIAMHVHPGLQAGSLSFRKGTVMASADELYIKIKGKGGHAAAPHLTTDTLLVAAHLVISLQQIISRNNDPFNPSVLSITSIQGGNTTNVIPSEVSLMGTLRCMNEEWRLKAHELIKRHVQDTCHAMGASADVHIDVGYPTVLNDAALTDDAIKQASALIGENNIHETEMRMGAEDFGYYAQKIPACFFRLGVMNKEKGITSGVHTPTFNIDEDSIETGMATMAWLGATVNP